MSRARDNANLGTQAGSGLDASDITTGALPVGVTGGSGLNALSASNLSAGTVPDARMPNLTGAITTVEGAVATTIADDAITGGKLANDIAISTSGAITTTGAFTSIGINDDSTSGHRLVIEDAGGTYIKNGSGTDLIAANTNGIIGLHALQGNPAATQQFSIDADGAWHTVVSSPYMNILVIAATNWSSWHTRNIFLASCAYYYNSNSHSIITTQSWYYASKYVHAQWVWSGSGGNNSFQIKTNGDQGSSNKISGSFIYLY